MTPLPWLDRVFIVAEIGSVHDGSFGNACKLVESAAAAGADAVKFQTHIADAETLPDAPMPPYFSGEPRMEYFRRTAFTREQWLQISNCCTSNNVTFMSSPFSNEAVDLLHSIGMKIFKIPSGETTNIPMLRRIGALKSPVILSSGMNSWAELDAAFDSVRAYHTDICILQCTTEYPCPNHLVGLNVLAEMKSRYKVPVGLSDHTLSIFASLAAVARGARIIEKHFSFSKLMYGSDARHSLEPGEFKEMAIGIRAIETMMSCKIDKNDLSRFREMKEIFEKSLVAVSDIPAGAALTDRNVGIRKPGTGIPAAQLDKFLGRHVKTPIRKNTLIRPEDLA
jgi:N,N'-diacetyllegionaminate synthase